MEQGDGVASGVELLVEPGGEVHRGTVDDACPTVVRMEGCRQVVTGEAAGSEGLERVEHRDAEHRRGAEFLPGRVVGGDADGDESGGQALIEERVDDHTHHPTVDLRGQDGQRKSGLVGDISCVRGGCGRLQCCGHDDK